MTFQRLGGQCMLQGHKVFGPGSSVVVRLRTRVADKQELDEAGVRECSIRLGARYLQVVVWSGHCGFGCRLSCQVL